MSFEKAVELVRSPAQGSEPSNDQKLRFYGLYKQATTGDCNTEKPGMIHVTEAAKWNAWNGLKGMSQEDAKTQYVEEARKIFPSQL